MPVVLWVMLCIPINLLGGIDSPILKNLIGGAIGGTTIGSAFGACLQLQVAKTFLVVYGVEPRWGL